MGKLLLIVATLVLVYVLVRAYQRGARRRAAPPAPRGQGAEDMVRCAGCGVHLPRSESLMSGGEFFCSEEHRRNARR
ncbi:MAG TPA: PP0621 family protein [Burkholderiales bacterium]|nr:PP0621 family protein [Burkholderiales bacterium]